MLVSIVGLEIILEPIKNLFDGVAYCDVIIYSEGGGG